MSTDTTDEATATLNVSWSHAERSACRTLMGGPQGATYELVGPGRYTAHELGEILSRVLDRRIEVRQQARPPPQAAASAED